ncbi:MAG: SMI1/KNR4 family protein [Zavarzinella sp.]|nr:SMI1/KNR4 family protein [Zavarzinella sp.]
MDEDRFARFLRRLEASRVAAPANLVGCTPAEIEALEARYGVRLPRVYRRYLEVMGHRSGRLFTCDHAAVFYPHVLAMTEEQRGLWAEAKAEDGSGPPPEFDLPADALLILSRLGEQFEFIRCGGQDDSPVWYFNTWEWRVRESAPTVLAWLESWCVEAERAIASGYFDVYPDGTTP